MNDFTLLIPTYNRPRQLAALLGYLEAEQTHWRVLVLDSSAPATLEFNRVRAEHSTLDIEYTEFPTDTRPFDKFCAGINRVTTPFCALCADDDLIIVEGVSRCLEALQEHPEASIAQGYSLLFTCEPDESMSLHNISYFTSSISDSTPLARLARLFRQYQAATYGNYRTPVLQRIFSKLPPTGDILVSELLGTALAAVEGAMICVPCFSHARSTGASESYEHWHPLEWFAKEPQNLFIAYYLYRDVLAQAIALRSDNANSPSEIRNILDLIHLGYLVQHAPKDAVEFIVGQKIAGIPFATYWKRPEIHRPLYLAAGFEASPLSLTEKFYQGLQLLRSGSRINRKAPGRHKRSYSQHPNFYAPTHVTSLKPREIERLLNSLDNYQLSSIPPVRSSRVSITILLCNYNDARYLPDFLRAICEQSRPPDEVIVVDDGSTDNSLDIIQDFAQRYGFIRVLINEHNCGPLYSINRALTHARSEFIVWAAADDRLLPNFLERNIECLTQNSNVQMTLSRLATFQDGSNEITAHTELNHGPVYDFGTTPRYWSPAELRERLQEDYLCLSGNAAVVSKSCLINVGSFDENLRWHADYFSFWVVALRSGLYTIPETLAAMRQRQNSYSVRGMSCQKDQRAVLELLADKLLTKGWRDIGLAFFHCPSLFAPFDPLILEVLAAKPRYWPLALSYRWWLGSRRVRSRLRRIKGMVKSAVQIAAAIVKKATSTTRGDLESDL